MPHLCHPSSAFIDCGAHIGSVIASVERYNPTVKIFAIEAMPDKAAWLVRRFPKVSVFNFALADNECETTFYVDPKRTGFSSLINPDGSNRIAIKVQMKRLDDIIPEDVAVDTIKIDVEGAEFRVMCGAARLIERCRPSIMFESAQLEKSEHSIIHDVFEWFSKQNYRIFVPNRVAHHGPSLTLDGFVEAHYYPRRSTNYFAIPSERRDEIRDRARNTLRIKAS